MASLIQLRRDTSSNWASVNPILAQGEVGIDMTLNKLKVGDGVNTWALLPWLQGDVSNVLTLLDLGIPDGTNGQVLSTNGSAAFHFVDMPVLPTNISELANDAGYITAADVPTDVAELADSTGLLAHVTKTSELVNDSGFLTAAAIPSKVSQFTNDVGYITSAAVPTDVSQLTDTTSLLAHSVPGGGNGAVQINVSGAFAAAAGAYYDQVNQKLRLTKLEVIGSIDGNLVPTTHLLQDIGTPTQRWKDIYLSTNTIHMGDYSIGIDGTGNLTGVNGYVFGDGSIQTTAADAGAIADAIAQIQDAIPTAVSELTNDAGYATQQEVQAAVAAVIDTAPELLNTLKELADAIGGDENFAATIAAQIAALQTAVDTLSTSSSGDITALQAAVAALQAADATLQTQIDNLFLKTSALDSVDTALQTQIDNLFLKTSALDSVDTALQTQIDALVVKDAALDSVDAALQAQIGALATVATTGSYTDLLDVPPTVTVDSTAPATPIGSLWFNEADGRMYVNDGTQWVDSSPIPASETYSLGELRDVTTAGSASGQFLGFDGNEWKPTALPQAPAETVTSLSVNGNVLQYTNETGNTVGIDLSVYLDDTNLARLVSGVIDPATGIATFSRDDSSTFTVDFSSLIDTVPTNVSELTNDAGYITLAQVPVASLDDLSDVSVAGATTGSFLKYINGTGWIAAPLSIVATTGSYTDLSNTPTQVSAFTNDAGYITLADVPPGGAAVGTTQPASPTLGQLWYDQNDGRMYVWDNSQWVDSSPIAPSETYTLEALSNVSNVTANAGDVLSFDGSNWVASAPTGSGGSSVTVSATQPTSPVTGDLWYDENVARTFVWNGSAWIDASPAGGGSGSTIPDGNVSGDILTWSGTQWGVSSSPLFQPFLHSADDASATTTYTGNNIPLNINTTGLKYFNDTTKTLRVWDGSVWVNAMPGPNELTDLTDVILPAGATQGDVLTINASGFFEFLPASGGGATRLDALNDTSIYNISTWDFVIHDGDNWINSPVGLNNGKLADVSSNMVLSTDDVLSWNGVQWQNSSNYISKTQLKTIVAASTDFADFQARIAAL